MGSTLYHIVIEFLHKKSLHNAPQQSLDAHVETGASEEICHDDEAAHAEPPDRDGSRDRP